MALEREWILGEGQKLGQLPVKVLGQGPGQEKGLGLVQGMELGLGQERSQVKMAGQVSRATGISLFSDLCTDIRPQCPLSKNENLDCFDQTYTPCILTQRFSTVQA